MEFILYMISILSQVKPEELVTAALIGTPVYFATKRLINNVMARFEKHAIEVKEEISGVRGEVHKLNEKVGDVAKGLDMVKTSHDERLAKNEFHIKELATQVNEIKQRVETQNQLIAP